MLISAYIFCLSFVFRSNGRRSKYFILYLLMNIYVNFSMIFLKIFPGYLLCHWATSLGYISCHSCNLYNWTMPYDICGGMYYENEACRTYWVTSERWFQNNHSNIWLITWYLTVTWSCDRFFFQFLHKILLWKIHPVRIILIRQK